jgi:hypothetical protein
LFGGGKSHFPRGFNRVQLRLVKRLQALRHAAHTWGHWGQAWWHETRAVMELWRLGLPCRMDLSNVRPLGSVISDIVITCR